MARKALLLFLLILGNRLFAQQDDSTFIRRIANEMLMNGTAYDDLRYLTKKIGPRLTGSAGMVKAEQWGLELMMKYGATHAWLQECMVPHWVRGTRDGAVVEYRSETTVRSVAKKLDVLALGNSEGTKGRGIKGQILLVRSFQELESRKDLVKGKIVFYNYKFNPSFINPFQAYGDAVQYRGAGASRASKYGAIGVIVRSMSESVDNNPHTGAMRYDSAFARIPAMAVGLRDADWLAEQVEGNRVISLAMQSDAHFLPDTIGHNVIGELTGSLFPDKIITLGGHLDSWDPGEGAHDDGAGCVQTIEVLRTLVALGYKPRHTIRFVLFMNEENGLRGGAKYAEEAKAKNEQHIFAFESDEGGFTPRGFGFEMTDTLFKKVLEWKELVAPYGCSEFKRGGGGSDIGPLQRAFQIPVAGLNVDPQRYFDLHHARNDVFENVNKRELLLGAVNMAALIYLVDRYGLGE